MEDLLLNIIKEANGPKLIGIRQSAQEAYGRSTLNCLWKNKQI